MYAFSRCPSNWGKLSFGAKGSRFDPAFEKPLTARQKVRSRSKERTNDGPVHEEDLTAPTTRREAKRGRKANSPKKSGSSSERCPEAFQRPILCIHGHLITLGFLFRISPC